MHIIRNILIGMASAIGIGSVTYQVMPPIITYTEIDASSEEMQENNASIIVMAFPEAICRTTEASYSALLPYVGIGQKEMIRAGHACLAIVRKGSEKIEYFDNGRYVAPEGFCRVRGENTDPELRVDVMAKWEDGKLANMEEILAWFYAHPEKTHGGGTLYAGVIDNANYQSAMECIRHIQDMDIIEYGPFAEGATNCARFVTDAIYNGALDPSVKSNIRDLYKFTPSGLSNIGASIKGDYYYRANASGVCLSDDNLDLIQLEALFDGGEGYTDYSTSGTLCPPDDVIAQDDWQWLGGLGYGLWFSVKPTGEPSEFMVECHNSKGKLNWADTFYSKSTVELSSSFQITYPSNYQKVTLLSDGKTITLERI